MLKNTASVAHIIRSGQLHQIYSKLETGFGDGMNTLEQHLYELVERGIISRQEAIAHANDVNLVNRFD